MSWGKIHFPPINIKCHGVIISSPISHIFVLLTEVTRTRIIFLGPFGVHISIPAFSSFAFLVWLASYNLEHPHTLAKSEPPYLRFTLSKSTLRLLQWTLTPSNPTHMKCRSLHSEVIWPSLHTWRKLGARQWSYAGFSVRLAQICWKESSSKISQRLFQVAHKIRMGKWSRYSDMNSNSLQGCPNLPYIMKLHQATKQNREPRRMHY
jgi:hypothetical protein